MLGKTFALDRAAPLNHWKVAFWKGHGFFLIHVSVPWKRTGWDDIHEEERKQFDLKNNGTSFLSWGWEGQLSRWKKVLAWETGIRRTTANAWHVREAWQASVYFDTSMEGSVDSTVRQFILARQVMQTVLGNPQDLSACWDQLLVNTWWWQENEAQYHGQKGKKRPNQEI